jgi:acetyl-CoA acetyltransferase
MSDAPAVIAGAFERPYERHPGAGVDTSSLLAEALVGALAAAGLEPREVDGQAVASFTVAPDSAIDLAWRLGLRLRWLAQSPLGGASGVDLLRQAVRAVEAGDASAVAILAGDRLLPEEFRRLTDEYNRATLEELAPLPFGGPNSLFALLTQRHMRATGLARSDYAQIPLAQRRWASGNPLAVYRAPLTLDDYLAAPAVAPPLHRFDCVPVVSGADALIVTASGRGAGPQIRPVAFQAAYDVDLQDGDGLATGLRPFADVAEPELVYAYDDYPVMVLIQLADLGIVDDPERFLREELPAGRPVNTSGGQLSAGQAGAAGGLHHLVEAVVQLRGEAGARQVANARSALVSGYGMVLYRYGACANACLLERL